MVIYENLTADELLSGRSPDYKLTLAEQLILDTLDKHPDVPAKVMYRLAEQASISPRTLKEAKRNLTSYVESVRLANEWNWLRKE